MPLWIDHGFLWDRFEFCYVLVMAHECWLCVPALLMIIGTFKCLNSPIGFYGNDRELIKLKLESISSFYKSNLCNNHYQIYQSSYSISGISGSNWPNCWVSSPKVISYSGTLSQGYPINSFYFRFGVSVDFGYLGYWPDRFFTPDHWSYVWICLSIFLNGKEWVFLRIIPCKVSTGRAGN